MSIISKITQIEEASGELDTAVRALHVLADNMADDGEDDSVHLVRFLAFSFGAIRARLQDGIQKAIRADRLKIVNDGDRA